MSVRHFQPVVASSSSPTAPRPMLRILVLSLIILIGMTWAATIRAGFAASSPRYRHLVDVLPNDLDRLQNPRVIQALGHQLLAFGGWSQASKGQDDSGTGSWTRRHTRRPLTLQDRLAFITPTWKKGGSLDYKRIVEPDSSLFPSEAERGITTVAQLADHLEHKVGLTVHDFDEDAIHALTAMLSWEISLPEADQTAYASLMSNGPTKNILLLILSFGSTESCRNSSDCPWGPGATNELLVSTAARFLQQQRRAKKNTNVTILAQWEVATSLWQRHNETLRHDSHHTTTVQSIGTPGSYETTSDVLWEMLCGPHGGANIVNSVILVLAHPDHLRRVLWTSQTLMHRKRSSLRFASGNMMSSCTASTKSINDKQPYQLITAMSPYHLDWPTVARNRTNGDPTNLFGLLEPTKVRIGSPGGEEIETQWYDSRYFGFFNDGDQEWTKHRDMWILYDHWAVLKGIVTQTIDLSSISTKNM